LRAGQFVGLMFSRERNVCSFHGKVRGKYLHLISVYHSRSKQQQRSLCIELFFESCNGFHVAVLCSVIDHR